MDSETLPAGLADDAGLRPEWTALELAESLGDRPGTVVAALPVSLVRTVEGEEAATAGVLPEVQLATTFPGRVRPGRSVARAVVGLRPAWLVGEPIAVVPSRPSTGLTEATVG